MLKQPLSNFLNHHSLLQRDRDIHFVVAYSGGRDSTALLHSLHQLQAEFNKSIKLTAAYYWHPWRPLQEDLAVIHYHCKHLQIPWVMLSPDLTLPKTETAAREDRYKQLARLSHDLSATALLTAHHQDDHLETILFRILRGTGIEGIVGIPETRILTVHDHHEICLARPFQNVTRAEIDAYVQQHQLRYVEDPTNTQTRLKRNYVRHELFPKILTAFPNARQSLSRLAELTAGELEIIDNKMEQVWQDLYNEQNNSLDEARFTQLAHSFQRRIIRRYLEQAGLEAGYNRIEDIIGFIDGKSRKVATPGLFSLGSDCFLSVYRNQVTLEIPKKQEYQSVIVSIPGEVSHLQLKTTLVITPLTSEQRVRPIDFTKVPKNQAYVDLSKLEGKELVLRTRQKGDRIKPLGMPASIKLKRFFINRSIPRFQRDSVPLLALDSEVLWAVGVGLSQEISVKGRPTHVITVKQG